MIAHEPPFLLIFKKSTCCPNYPSTGIPVWLHSLAARLYNMRAQEADALGKQQEADADRLRAKELSNYGS
ncbi:MAG: hypothetical protein JW841_09870 [Deltaproteobacteria bacterium]|nr:hypothetical protein [Deltaproteobacteria bacterium]